MIDATPLDAGRTGDGWHLSLRRHRLIPRALGALAVGCVVVAVVQVRSENVELGILLLIVAPAFAAAPGWRHRRAADPYCGDTVVGPALVLPVNPRTVAFASSAFFLGAACVEAGRALAVRATEQGDRALGIVLLAMFLIFGAVLGSVAVAAVRSRFRSDLGLLLTARSLVVNTHARRVVVPWADVVGLRPHWVRRTDGDWFGFDDDVVNYLTVQVRPGATPQPPRALDVSQLACRPELVLAILRFYLDTPSARAGLGTDAALTQVSALASEV